MPDLRPCPFCGSAALLSALEGEPEGEGFWAWAYCPLCNANGSDKTTRAEAIATWNTRPIEDALLAACEDALAFLPLVGDGGCAVEGADDAEMACRSAIANAKKGKP